MIAYRQGGEPAVFRERLDEIIKMFPEFVWQRSHEEAYWQICESTEDLDQWVEVTVRDPQGRLVGFAVAADDDDAHVGPLLGVQWCVVFPEAPAGTALRIHRELHKVAKAANYTVLAYTKRLSEGRYEINYRKL